MYLLAIRSLCKLPASIACCFPTWFCVGLQTASSHAAFLSAPTHPGELTYAHIEAPGLVKVVWWSMKVKWMFFMVIQHS